MVYKQNLVNRKFPYIGTFDHEGPIVVSVMCNITVGVFENLDITITIDVYQRVAYTQRILKGSALKKYREFLVACRQSAKELAGYEWKLGELAGLSTEYLWTWTKTYTTGYDGHAYLAMDKCVDFERKLWSKLGKFMQRKHRSIY